MTAPQPRGLPPGHRLLTPQDQGGLSRLDYSTRRRLAHRSGQPSLQPTALTWGAHIRQAGSRQRCLRRKTGPTGATLGSGQSAAGHGVFGRCFGATEHRGVTRARPTGRATWRPTPVTAGKALVLVEAPTWKSFRVWHQPRRRAGRFCFVCCNPSRNGSSWEEAAGRELRTGHSPGVRAPLTSCSVHGGS